MHDQDRLNRAQSAAAPHLDEAFRRVIERGVSPADAAQAVIVFGAMAMSNHLLRGTGPEGVLKARDQMYAWMTDIAHALGETVNAQH